MGELSVLGESNHVGSLSEALPADVDTVLPDETSRVGANTTSSRSLTVLSGSGEPNSLVSHIV